MVLTWRLVSERILRESVCRIVASVGEQRPPGSSQMRGKWRVLLVRWRRRRRGEAGLVMVLVVLLGLGLELELVLVFGWKIRPLMERQSMVGFWCRNVSRWIERYWTAGET